MNVLEQEQTYRFDTFNNEMAYQFGEAVVTMVKEQGLKPVRIRVVYNGDIVYQYLMEGKAGVEWLDRKQRTVEASNHASMYVAQHTEDYPALTFEDGYAPCGGGFPLIVNNKVKGSLIISGLADYEDHDLIIAAIKKVKEM